MDPAWFIEAVEGSVSFWNWVIFIFITAYDFVSDFVEAATESALVGEIVRVSGSFWNWISYIPTAGDQACRAFINLDFEPFTPLNCALLLAVRLLLIYAIVRLEAYSLRWNAGGEDDPLFLRLDVDDMLGIWKVEQKPRIPGTWPEESSPTSTK
ncbi:hypothetical protein BDP55DRAFT_340047 [Colletotrichum godetiae]|uniref:Uncharacterized protein n=1 Tax=Colletotrichum godetiae TaxID=1209918 RepID=A0AAJ0F247_9PEZI|nr:uncharacterized protein BDP55DRAFT_340047 [Colletotrichum godetiae]KAK1690133.1 hypothetical protein BDP55DRAFT_340047 [Colletotrichum godetiae]